MEAKIYKCPYCASALTYNGSAGQMVCPACGSTVSVADLQTYSQGDQEQFNRSETFQPDFEEDTQTDPQNLRAYTCSSCGSRMVVTDTSAAAECPYCGNPSVLPGVLDGVFKPDAIIPFKTTKEQAMSAFKSLCAGKRLLPKGFSDESRVQKITGIYVPFWLYKSTAQGDFTYNGTKVSSRRSGDYRITTTRYYQVQRTGKLSVENLPVNSSSKIDDTLMEAIEPFQITDAKAFHTAYLAGSQAERYDQKENECRERANTRISQSLRSFCANSARVEGGYSTLTQARENITITSSRAYNYMMPVWILNTSFKDKVYTFAMNGQTGKVIGNLPVDKGAALRHFLLRFAAVSAVLTGCAYILFSMGVL